VTEGELRNIKQLQTPRYAILLPSFCDALASQKSTSLPEGGFGANRLFRLSNFCLKLTDKPEFEGLVRVQMGGPSRTPFPTKYQFRLTDKPEFTHFLF